MKRAAKIPHSFVIISTSANFRTSTQFLFFTERKLYDILPYGVPIKHFKCFYMAYFLEFHDKRHVNWDMFDIFVVRDPPIRWQPATTTNMVPLRGDSWRIDREKFTLKAPKWSTVRLKIRSPSGMSCYYRKLRVLTNIGGLLSGENLWRKSLRSHHPLSRGPKKG